MKNDNEKEDQLNKSFDAISEAEFELTKWFGAIFFYLHYFKKKSFEELSSEKYSNRNVIVGYLFN